MCVQGGTQVCHRSTIVNELVREGHGPPMVALVSVCANSRGAAIRFGACKVPAGCPHVEAAEIWASYQYSQSGCKGIALAGFQACSFLGAMTEGTSMLTTGSPTAKVSQIWAAADFVAAHTHGSGTKMWANYQLSHRGSGAKDSASNSVLCGCTLGGSLHQWAQWTSLLERNMQQLLSHKE